MLYLTTRDKNDAYTAYSTLGVDRGSSGGFFVPYQMPHHTREQISGLKDNAFGQNVADILNQFFSARMDGWDVDFCIGRYPTRLVTMSHRIIFAETWHNPDLDFSRLVRNLSSRIRGIDDTIDDPTNWAGIAVRIAVLFGVFGELMKSNLCDVDHPVDVAVASGDFSVPMALWYARSMGLPVGNIICGCNDNGGVWDLLHHGALHTDGVAVKTASPEGDLVVPPNLERLVHATLGADETRRFLEICAAGKSYSPPQAGFEDLRRGMYAGVVSGARMHSIIRSVYNTNTYIMDPYTALAFSALQDYRNRYAENRTAIVLSERSPIRSAETVSEALGISRDALAERLNLD